MEERAVPALVSVDQGDNLTTFVSRNARTRPDHPAILVERDGTWRSLTCKDFEREVVDLAQGFIAAGIEAGDRVAIMSRTRYEWTLCDFALWFAGAVPVPVYETSSASQVAWILQDSGAVAIVVESREHANTVDEVRDTCPDLRQVWTMENNDLVALVEAGRAVPETAVQARAGEATLDSVATIIYTSGTTGRPKGCVLTHGNFAVTAANAHAELREVLEAPGATTLLFLPLAHVFARFIEVLFIESGVTTAHCSDTTRLVQMCGEVKPTIFLAVPRVFQKVFNAAEQKANASGRGKLFGRAVDTAIEYSKAQEAGGRVSLGLRLRYALFDRLVYPKLRAVLGGRATYAVSGGGPLGERLGHFFRGTGLVILEGYGLTECTAPTSVNVPAKIKIGTVGPPLPGCTIRIAQNGEVLLKGPHVFRGYHNNEDATSEAFQDGWLHTGDLGELDDEGYLRITGRAKEILVTAGGKNVAPAVLEGQLRAHPIISQAMVVGDGQPYVAALITLDPEMLPGWLKNHGLDETMSPADAARNSTVRAAVQEAIDGVNTTVSRPESIRRFDILDVDWTVEGGYLSAKQELKRGEVMKGFGAEVDSLYR